MRRCAGGADLRRSWGRRWFPAAGRLQVEPGQPAHVETDDHRPGLTVRATVRAADRTAQIYR